MYNQVQQSEIFCSVNNALICCVWISEQTTIIISIQHKLIGFYNPDEKCLQRGTDWVFIYRQF